MTVEEKLKSAEEQETVASGLHGVLGLRLGRYLGNYVDEKQLGWTFNSSTSFRIKGQPPSRQPDVAFVTLERMSTPPDDDVPFAPDLAIEVISRNDDWSEVVAKANQYLQAETRLVWAVDPYTKSIFVFHKNIPKMQVLGLDDELDGEDVVPGFKLKVGLLFNYNRPAI